MQSKAKIGDRVVVPFVIACGHCFFCGKQQFAACDNSNPSSKADVSEFAYGYPMTGAFGYSHMTGGYAGGQAEYVRVPFSDVGPIVVPDGIEDEKVLFLSDILPTGWMAAENCMIEDGDTVAVKAARHTLTTAAQDLPILSVSLAGCLGEAIARNQRNYPP